MSREKAVAVKKILPLTGLVKCSYCGHSLILQERLDRNGSMIIKKCWYRDKTGKKCSNRSGPLEPILDKLNAMIIKYADEIEYEIENIVKIRKGELETELTLKNKQLKSENAKLEKIYDYLESGTYTEKEFNIRKKKYNAEIVTISEEIQILNLELNNLSVELNEDRLNILNCFEDIISSDELDYEELNNLYKSIIKSIVYTRDIDDRIQLKIEYK